MQQLTVLYDYSRGAYTTNTKNTGDNGADINAGLMSVTWNASTATLDTVQAMVPGTCTKSQILKLSGFSSTGVGKLTGPDGK